MTLDRTERRILEALQQDGRLANVDLAARIGLSESPCLRRVRNLERQGVIEGYAAIIDQRSLGLSVTAFVLVTLDKQPDVETDGFHACVLAEPHIVECHATTGSHDFLMKVVARDIDHFSVLMMQGILKFPGVRHVESSFSLDVAKRSGVLPVAGTD